MPKPTKADLGDLSTLRARLEPVIEDVADLVAVAASDVGSYVEIHATADVQSAIDVAIRSVFDHLLSVANTPEVTTFLLVTRAQMGIDP